MAKQIIVAGGGHGGIAAAHLLAKRGYDVTVYERHTRENMGYDWTDIFDKKGFFAAEMDLPVHIHSSIKIVIGIDPAENKTAAGELIIGRI